MVYFFKATALFRFSKNNRTLQETNKLAVNLNADGREMSDSSFYLEFSRSLLNCAGE